MDIKTIKSYLNTHYNNIIVNINNVIEEVCKISNIKNSNRNDNQIKADIYYIEKIVRKHFDDIVIFQERQRKLHNLLEMKLPEQRSPEWYEMRRDKLTASSIATAMGEDHFNSKYKLIHDKLTNAPHISNIHTEWGTKYEEIATRFYQLITGTIVKEFGMIPHPYFPIFGASPDGICDDSGPQEYCSRMLEIKCPTRREFWKRGTKSKWMPHHYWMQMQGQLEVCDLDECDFLQVKLEEYKDDKEYNADILNLDLPFKYSYPNINGYDTTINGKTKDNLPKGCVISYFKEGENTFSYLYPPLLQSYDEAMNWIDSHIKSGINIQEIKWWKIVRYEVDLVKRDKEWWLNNIHKIISFYDDYVYYREHLDELEKKVMKTDKEVNINISVPAPDFALCGSSSDDDIEKKSNINTDTQITELVL